jgi:ribonuclease M5
MIKIQEAIVVEGRYDKNTLSQIVDAPIFQTNGFQIHKDKETLMLLRRVAQMRGLIVLTDSDGAGFVIRNYLKKTIPAKFLKHAYIPDIFGKERRKVTPGKEGKLGVEGMTPEVILESLRNAGATVLGEAEHTTYQITKQDFADLGLSGGKNSSLLRKQLLKELNLPEHLSSNGMLQAVNLLYSKAELEEMIKQMEKQDD